MNKKTLTEIVLKELPSGHADLTLPIEKLYFRYWITGRSGNVLRLTNEGYQAFLAAGIQEYSYTVYIERLAEKLNNIKSTELALKMGKLIKCPWHLTMLDRKTMILNIFDSKTAMMINLYGSVEDYFELKL